MKPILEFVPRCSRHSKSMGQGPQCFSKCREEVEVALASKPATEAAVKVERAAKVSSVEPVSVTPISAVTKNANALRKRGRPRVLSDERRREKVRQRVADWRAAKAGKAVGSSSARASEARSR
jgi:hypothetical protein